MRGANAFSVKFADDKKLGGVVVMPGGRATRDKSLWQAGRLGH